MTNVIKLHDNKQITYREVLEYFNGQLPNADEEKELPPILNACVIYHTKDGFSYNILNYENLIGLLGALECAKTFFIDVMLGNSETTLIDGGNDGDEE